MTLEQPTNESKEQILLNALQEKILDFFGDINEAYCAINIVKPKDTIDEPPSQANVTNDHFLTFDSDTKQKAFVELFEEWTNFLTTDHAERLRNRVESAGQLNKMTQKIEQIARELQDIAKAKEKNKHKKAA